MMVIGLDFGTTNSILCYHDSETDKIDTFELIPGKSDFIPTIVAYDNDSVFIGEVAKSTIFKKNYDTYSNFKLKLGKDFNMPIHESGRTPHQVAKDFIEKLLDSYKKQKNTGNFDKIVMTIPAAWSRENSNLAVRENIKSIYDELGYGNVITIESEPVAAAAYFCEVYKSNKENPKCEPYEGFILVVDFGGGTLDTTLCKVEPKENKREEIQILECCGFGEYTKTNGCAGVAFDEAVVEHLIKKHGLDIKKYKSDSQERTFKYTELCQKFEEEKIQDLKITESFKKYFKGTNGPRLVEGKGRELFSIVYDMNSGESIDVYCEDLIICFNEVNKPHLEKSLEEIVKYFHKHNVDIESQEKFKVLLVGGFSNFCPVEQTVRKFLFDVSMTDADYRLPETITKYNRSYAIAKGAFYIAKNDNVVHTCDHEIGFIARVNHSQKPSDVPVIKHGVNIKDVSVPQWTEKYKFSMNLGAAKIPVYMNPRRSDGLGRIEGSIGTASELFPNLEDKENMYEISFSVDRNMIPTIYARDRHGNEKQKYLKNFVEDSGITAFTAQTLTPKINSIIKFGGYDWCVRGVHNGEVLLITKDIIEKHRFDISTNNWTNCELRKHLNGVFYNSLDASDKLRIVSFNSDDVYCDDGGVHSALWLKL